MKNLMLLLLTFVGVLGASAQSIDLSKGNGNGVNLERNTLSSITGGSYYLPEQDYKTYQGIKLVLSNFVKLDESASNTLCSINVIYANESGQEKKATASFWLAGKKEISFSDFKNGNEMISINPANIKKVAIGIGANKKIDVSVEMVPDKK